MGFVELFEALEPHQKALLALIPLGGIFVGWILKTLTEFLVRAKDEWAKRRECLFYLLKSWKDILDLERSISHISKSDVDVVEYERMRFEMVEFTGKRLANSEESLMKGIVSLASIDPASAAQLENTLKNFLNFLGHDFSELLEEDEDSFTIVNRLFYRTIDWTLDDMSNQAEKLAAKSGPLQRWKVKKWFKSRIEGGDEFHEGMAKIQQEWAEEVKKG